MLAVIQVSPLATPGSKGLTITGLNGASDTIPDVFNVTAATFPTLTAGANPITLANGGAISGKATLPVAAALSVPSVSSTPGTSTPYIVGVAAADGEVLDIGGGAFDSVNFVAGTKDYLLFAYDLDFLIELFNNLNYVDGVDPLDAVINYEPGVSEAIGAGLTGEELATAGSERWFSITATNRWDLHTVDIVPSGAMFPALRAHHEVGNSSAPQLDSGFFGIVVAGGEDLDILIGVSDGDGLAFGAGEAFDVDIATAAPAGTMIENTTDAAIPEEGMVTSTVMAATGFTSLDAVHVGLDITHTYVSDLYIELASPEGTVVELACYPGSDEDGLVEVFPDTSFECGFIDDFTFDTSWDGTWTLTVYDDYAPDSGIVRAWALFLEGS
jgi:subtilisin-like proprotein convertase family protein